MYVFYLAFVHHFRVFVVHLRVVVRNVVGVLCERLHISHHFPHICLQIFIQLIGMLSKWRWLLDKIVHPLWYFNLEFALQIFNWTNICCYFYGIYLALECFELLICLVCYKVIKIFILNQILKIRQTVQEKNNLFHSSHYPTFVFRLNVSNWLQGWNIWTRKVAT